MQINNNRTWMNMKVCLLAKRRDQPGTVQLRWRNLLRESSTQYQSSIFLQPHLNDMNPTRTRSWLELLPSGGIRMARSRIQHSCNYVINTNVKLWGRNNIKCYDTSPSSCIKINTNYQRSFLHRNNEPRYASWHLSSGHQLLSSINNNIESTCSCKLKSSIPQIEIFQASMRTMLEPNG